MAPYTLLAGGYEDRIETISFDPYANPPTLDIISSSKEAGVAPTWLIKSPEGTILYAVDEWGPTRGELTKETQGILTAMKINSDGSLSAFSSLPSGGAWPCHGTLIPTTPPQILTSHYMSATITATPLLPSGEFDPDLSKRYSIEIKGQGKGLLGPIGWRQEQNHPHGTHLSPDGKFVIVPDLGSDELFILGIKSDGKLEIVDAIYLEAGDGPRHVLFDTRTDGTTLLYVLNELNNSISVYSYSSTSTSTKPTIRLLQSRVSALPPQPSPHQTDFTSWHCAELLISPDHRFLYCSNRAEGHDPSGGTHIGPTDPIAIMAINQDGTLAKPTFADSGTRAPRNFSLSEEGSNKEGKYLAVAGHDSDHVVIFERVGAELKEVVSKRGFGRPGHLVWL